MEEFYSFPVVLVGISKILLFIAMGFALSAFKIVKKGILDILSGLLLWGCFPALMFAKITMHFELNAFRSWWILPISALLMSCAGFGLGYISQKPFKGLDARREFMAACAFQNCGYLPLALIVFITTGALREKLLIYIFLFLTGFNVGLWSFAPPFLSDKQEKGALHKAIINPPMIGMLAAFMTTILFGRGWVPVDVMQPLVLLGNASFPLSLILVGISLEIHKGYQSRSWGALCVCIFVKLVTFPLGVLALLSCIPLEATDKFIIFLQATMPVATTLLVIGHYEEADNAFLSGSIFYSHLAAIVTVPAWLYLFSLIF